VSASSAEPGGSTVVVDVSTCDGPTSFAPAACCWIALPYQ
jgi:hypothetical protein